MRHVAVFARWPRVGTVKTRLHPGLGPELATRLYEAMLRDAVAAAGSARAGRRHLLWADAPPDAAWDGAPGFASSAQTGADLGERLARAFDTMLATAADRAVVIGADAPRLEAAGIDRALDALDDHDVALGPAGDGGYHLVALARPAPELFRGVSWGTDRVWDETLARARAAGLRVAELAPLDDVDDAAGLVRFLAAAARDPRGAEHTRAALRGFGLLP
jgi:uncharacterized protein